MRQVCGIAVKTVNRMLLSGLTIVSFYISYNTLMVSHRS